MVGTKLIPPSKMATMKNISLLGQRLVFYLAVADLLFSIVHFVDHLYAVLQITFGFEEFCVTAAFFLNVSLFDLSAYYTGRTERYL